jgi:hypothetical protein
MTSRAHFSAAASKVRTVIICATAEVDLTFARHSTTTYPRYVRE